MVDQTPTWQQVGVVAVLALCYIRAALLSYGQQLGRQWVPNIWINEPPAFQYCWYGVFHVFNQENEPFFFEADGLLTIV